MSPGIDFDRQDCLRGGFHVIAIQFKIQLGFRSACSSEKPQFNPDDSYRLNRSYRLRHVRGVSI